LIGFEGLAHLADLGPLQVADVVGEVGQHAKGGGDRVHVVNDELRLYDLGRVVGSRKSQKAQGLFFKGPRVVKKEPGRVVCADGSRHFPFQVVGGPLEGLDAVAQAADVPGDGVTEGDG